MSRIFKDISVLKPSSTAKEMVTAENVEQEKLTVKQDDSNPIVG